MARWVHMLGFRGHFVTKSRDYSTTLGELRAARATYRGEQDNPPDGEVDGDSTVVLSAGQYIGSGYLDPRRRHACGKASKAARDALLDLRCALPPREPGSATSRVPSGGVVLGVVGDRADAGH